MHIEWNDKEVVERVGNIADHVSERGAEMIRKDAIRLVKKRTGRLATEIDIRKSKFKDGGYRVVAQGTGNYADYYASFLELGTFKDKAQPYLRPAMKRNKFKIKHLYQEAIEK